MKLIPGEVERIGVELAVLKAKAGKLGLWRTVHDLDQATKGFATDIAAQYLNNSKPQENK